MKKLFLNFFIIWSFSTILIYLIIYTFKLKKEDEITKSFYSTAKLISKQRVDSGLRTLSYFYNQQKENEKEKFLIIDNMIRKFNINSNFSFKTINVEFVINKDLSHNYTYYKDVINENKILYIYENTTYIKQKIYDLIPTLFDAFRFGKEGYVFVYDDKGNCYYHFNKKYIGQNRWNLKRNNTYILQLLIKKAKQYPHGTYVEYLAFNPNGKPTKKISYVTYFKPLNLILGSGVYIKDLKFQLNNLDKELYNMFKQAEATMSFILFMLFLIRKKYNQI